MRRSQVQPRSPRISAHARLADVHTPGSATPVSASLAVPTTDIAAMRELWRREALPVTLELEDVGFAQIF